ncbi:MAG TPA: universal stress protein [Burkholderiales bacterium]|nr:universal stress protein [Burkholderiales bacterium]
MKLLVPVDGSQAALTALLHVGSLSHSGVAVETLLLNVQPRFHRHVSQFTSRAARDSLRAERSAAAMAPAIEALSRTRLPFRTVSELGNVAERIAAVAEREKVDEIVMGTGRHPQWLRWLNPSIAQAVMQRTDIPVTVLARGQAGALERYALPAGLAGLAALLLT